MITLELKNISIVFGGVMVPLAYAGIGYVGFTALKLYDNPDSTGKELAVSCTTGAVHSLNPGLGLSAQLFTSPLARYAAGIAYGAGVRQFERTANALINDDTSMSDYHHVNNNYLIAFESAQ
jgi:hypothetical protein